MRPWLLAAALSGLVGCAGLARDDRGVLQPQTVSGPCDAKKFYLLAFTAVDADLAITNTGRACTLTLINADQQIRVTAALVTRPAGHGQATATVLGGGFQAGISYQPQPGYAGPDAFTVTLEPNDLAIRFHVTVASH